jgi:hypothetical protein
MLASPKSDIACPSKIGQTQNQERECAQDYFHPGDGAALTACATQPSSTALGPPGFWYGLLHGFIAPFALIGAFFTDVRIYAFPNSGWWYDLGIVIGISALSGGGASTFKNSN